MANPNQHRHPPTGRWAHVPEADTSVVSRPLTHWASTTSRPCTVYPHDPARGPVFRSIVPRHATVINGETGEGLEDRSGPRAAGDGHALRRRRPPGAGTPPGGRR